MKADYFVKTDAFDSDWTFVAAESPEEAAASLRPQGVVDVLVLPVELAKTYRVTRRVSHEVAEVDEGDDE